MKTIITPILLVFLLIIATATSNKQNDKEVDKVGKMISENEEHISKANAVVKVADQQQIERMNKLRETVCKLEKEKQMLKSTLELTKNELVVIKEVLYMNPTDSNGY